MKSYLELLRNRPSFKYLWLAQVVSLFGDWFNAVATVALVSRYTDTGLAIGALFLARFLPPFVLGPLAGIIADKVNRKAILIVADLLRGLIVLGFLLVNSAETAWLIYLLSVVQFSISSFFEPTRNALLPTLIKSDELVTANTLGSISYSAMLTLGSALGGLTAAYLGIRTALIIDAASFIVSAFLAARIILPAAPAEIDSRAESFKEMIRGFTYVLQVPAIAFIVAVKGLMQVGSVDVMNALYAERVFPLGEEGALSFGLLMAAHGAGAVIGPLITNRLGSGTRRSLLINILVGFILVAVSWLGFGLAPGLVLATLAMLLRGMGGSINWTYSTILLQLEVPGRYLGRIFALDFAFFTLAMFFSVWITGFAVDTFGIPLRSVALFLAGGCLIPLALWAWFISNRVSRGKSENYVPVID